MAVIEQTPRPMMGNLRNIAGLNGKLAFPVLFYLVAVMLPIGFNVGPLYMNLVRLILLVMIVPLTANLFAGRYGGIKIPDVFFFLHVGWIIVAIGINNPDRAVQYVGSTVIEFIGSYVLARAYIRTAEDFVALIRIFMMMIILTVPIALIELLTNDPLALQILAKIPGVKTEGVVVSADEMRMGLFRVQGVFAHPIHYGMFCSLGFALCFIGLKDIYGTKKRYLVAGITMFCTFMSLSSGALLPVMLQIGLLVWAFAFNWTHHRWLILTCLIVLAYVVVDIISNRGPIIVFMSYATFSPWNAYWRAIVNDLVMDNVWANPWIGVGLGDWVRPGWMHSGSVDNFWLVVALRYGFPGIILLLVGYLSSLWTIGRRNFDSDPLLWQLRRAWMIAFVGMTMSLITVHVWSTLFSFVFFMFGAGMWFMTTTPKSDEATDLTTDGLPNRLKSGPRPTGPVLARTHTVPKARDGLVPTQKAISGSPRDTDGPRYTRFPPKTDPAEDPA